MRGKRLFIGFRTALAVFTIALFVTSTWAQEKVLHSFNPEVQDGGTPYASLIVDGAGNLYGTTYGGGIHSCYDGQETGCGTVFELSPREGGGYTETVQHSFGNGTDGQYPIAGLIFDAAGNLYGTTWAGGIHGHGTVFEITP